MPNFTYTAADELDRRTANKAAKAAGLATTAAPKTPEGQRLFHLSTGDLRAEAGIVKPAKVAKVAKVKPVRTAAEQAQIDARKAAWAFRSAEFKAGRKVTYAAACAKFGTTPKG